MSLIFVLLSRLGKPMGSRLILWGVGTSRTIRPHWALHELGMDYETRPILPRTGETQTPEYAALNPRRKIPLLQDGEFIIGESAAIVAYLSNKYATPDNQLVPRDPRRQASWLEWCFYIATELDATSLYVIRRHRELKHIYGDAPDVVTSASKYFLGQLGHVDHALNDGRRYLMDEHFTSADILLTTCLSWAIGYGIDVPTNCLDYVERITARVAYRRALESNDAKHNTFVPAGPQTR